ncbi:MAG TPA: MaoC/PaaZ C-terminal domain-containing protein [Burkholderiales bacterium]|nr:MaoC/PaaZ C-terminal domain-containing protein [Burkholderiales bacterium]
MSQLYLDDLNPGDRFEGETHVLDEAAFEAFARLTGDAHPIHYDREYARATRFGERVAHGLLLVAMTALGATALSARLRDSMVALVEQGFRFRKAVLVGEGVRPVFTVEATERARGRVRFRVELLNTASNETVAEGFHEYVLKNRG